METMTTHDFFLVDASETLPCSFDKFRDVTNDRSGSIPDLPATSCVALKCGYTGGGEPGGYAA
jgi:hypothetical protein